MIWILSNYLQNEPFLKDYGELLIKFDFVAAILLSFFFYLFCLNFPTPKEISFKNKFIIYIPVLFLSILSFTDFVIKDIYFKNHTIQFNTGKAFWTYSLCLFFYTVGGLQSLIRKYKKSVGIERTQILFVLLGLFLTILISVPLNLILPQIIFIPLEIGRIGIYSFLFFCTFTAFAIIRHHLFEIKVILTEIFVASIGLILLIQAWMSNVFWQKVLNWSIFILFCIFGYYLIKATIGEIQKREQVERISRDLEKAYRELKKLDIAKSEFISIASHQLRTPLTAIKGYVSLIGDKAYGVFPSKMKKPLTNIYASVERLIKLVNDLLSISRIEAGKIKVEPEEFLLEELITDVLEELRNLAKAKNLYIRLEKQEEPCNKVFLDVAKIRQVILNIVDNGIKYTQIGGITITYGQDKDLCKIEIKDTGAGMTKSEISMLFKTFSRGVAGQKTWTEGAGLGLYIAKQFTEMHNGKIWVKSAGNKKGSTFYIELPIKYEEKI